MKIEDLIMKIEDSYYEKLVQAVYALEVIGVINDASDVVGKLDEIIEQDSLYNYTLAMGGKI